jgi:hypothetical protein
MGSVRYTTRELPQRFLQILERARANFNADKVRREPFRRWYEDKYSRAGKKGWVPNEIIKNGYLQVPRQRGWYWLDPKLMNEEPIIDDESEVPGDYLRQTDDNEIEAAEAGFQLEDQLRDFIAHNLSNIPIEGKRLRLYVGSDGRDGIEYPSGVGPIDILAVDDLGEFFVFELKLARSPDQTIGQLMRYMGWVKQTIAMGRDPHGVIVARSITDKLRYAASVLPNVSLFEYEIEFRLKPANELPK